MATHRRTIEANLQELSASRSDLTDWLESLGCVSSARAFEIALVFGELLTNAIEASNPSQTVDYRFHCDHAKIGVRVVNPNPGTSVVELQSMPDPLNESGRGLALAQEYADRLNLIELGSDVDIEALFKLEAQPITIRRPAFQMSSPSVTEAAAEPDSTADDVIDLDAPAPALRLVTSH